MTHVTEQPVTQCAGMLFLAILCVAFVGKLHNLLLRNPSLPPSPHITPACRRRWFLRRVATSFSFFFIIVVRFVKVCVVCVVDVPSKYCLAVEHLPAGLARVLRLDDDVILAVRRLRPTLATTCSGNDRSQFSQHVQCLLGFNIRVPTSSLTL